MERQNSLAKPSSSLVPEKALRTLYIPISISATNPNNWGRGEVDRVLTSRQKQNKTTTKPWFPPPPQKFRPKSH